MYLVVSISTSPKTDFCVCHVCTLLKQSNDVSEEVLEEEGGFIWILSTLVAILAHLVWGRGTRVVAQGLPFPTTFWNLTDSIEKVVRGTLLVVASLYGMTYMEPQTQSGNEWNVTRVYCFCCLRGSLDSYILTFGRKCRDAYSQDVLIALARWLLWLCVMNSPTWKSGHVLELATRPQLLKDRSYDSSMTLKPALVSLQSIKQVHESIKNKLQTQANQGWVLSCVCCHICFSRWASI